MKKRIKFPVPLIHAYQDLIGKWNALWNEPEYNEAAKEVKERKEREVHLAADAKREEQERQERHQNILSRFITEGQNALREFSLSSRTEFDDKEAHSIYYGIMATAHKKGLNLSTKEGVSSAVSKFLDGLSWFGCSDFREECVSNWTHLFAERDATYEPSIIDNFISFVDYMSLSADTYASFGGSNGCADQLTNWDGTKKQRMGAVTKKKGQSF